MPSRRAMGWIVGCIALLLLLIGMAFGWNFARTERLNDDAQGRASSTAAPPKAPANTAPAPTAPAR